VSLTGRTVASSIPYFCIRQGCPRYLIPLHFVFCTTHRNMSSPSRDPGRPPFPPFTLETAQIKVKAAQDAWNTKYKTLKFWFKVSLLTRDRNPQLVKNAYTPDSIWRNRDTFLRGTDEIVKFLEEKWATENGYRLRKELFAFTGNKVRHCLSNSQAHSLKNTAKFGVAQ
jgi:nuclear transport factor 2 (NTF2) superfamily protein